MRLELAQRRAPCTEPGSHTRPRSLRARSTIITFSARSFALARSRAGDDRRALDRPRLDRGGRRRARNRSGDADTTATSTPGTSAPVRRNDACGAGLPVSSAHHSATGSAGRGAGEPAGEVHLVAVAGLDVVDDRAHAGLELGPVEARRPTARARARARRRPTAAASSAALELAPGRAPTDDPARAGPAVELGVRREPEEAEHPGRKPGRRDGPGRDPLDAAAEVVGAGTRPTSPGRAGRARPKASGPSTAHDLLGPAGHHDRGPVEPDRGREPRRQGREDRSDLHSCRVPGACTVLFGGASVPIRGHRGCSLPPSWRAFVRPLRDRPRRDVRARRPAASSSATRSSTSKLSRHPPHRRARAAPRARARPATSSSSAPTPADFVESESEARRSAPRPTPARRSPTR